MQRNLTSGTKSNKKSSEIDYILCNYIEMNRFHSLQRLGGLIINLEQDTSEAIREIEVEGAVRGGTYPLEQHHQQQSTNKSLHAALSSLQLRVSLSFFLSSWVYSRNPCACTLHMHVHCASSKRAQEVDGHTDSFVLGDLLSVAPKPRGSFRVLSTFRSDLQRSRDGHGALNPPLF